MTALKRKKENKKTDSPEKDESEFICIGKIHRAHGMQGEVVMNPMTDFPERIQTGKEVYLGSERRLTKILAVREKPPYLLVRLEGFSDEVESAELRNTFVFVRKDSLPKLQPGEFYFHELIGLAVEDLQGNPLGRLREILETGANDVYLVEQPNGDELLLPDIPAVICSILPDQGKMIVNPPQWL